MKTIFIILGYGIPKDVNKDGNFGHYLKFVFNAVFEEVRRKQIKSPVLIFSGGNSDMYPPYKRVESVEKRKYFQKLASRSFLRKETRDWQLLAEKQSLSSLENLLNSKKILAQKKIKPSEIYIFCEFTRQNRIKRLAKTVFGKKKITVIAVDFDVSSNRYLDQKFIKKKEQSELAHSLWALKSKANLRKHHQSYKKKVQELRQMKRGENHAKDVERWWRENVGKLPYGQAK